MSAHVAREWLSPKYFCVATLSLYKNIAVLGSRVAKQLGTSPSTDVFVRAPKKYFRAEPLSDSIRTLGNPKIDFL